jgi:succinate dehydrogenase / fumarate reductase membrane anchor subunit
MVNRIVVGAHYGVRGWLIQRITAVVMAVYVFGLVIALMVSGPVSHASWSALFSNGAMRVGTLLFVISVLLHAWVGIRDVLMDYIKNTGLRLTLQVLTVLWLVGCAGWALQILWRV